MATIVNGTLKGVSTERLVKFSAIGPATLHFTVTHKGKGDNPLHVRAADAFILIWAQFANFKVAPGRTVTRKLDFDWDYTPDTTDGKQDFRLRLSRDVLTKEIPWEIKFWVTAPEWL
jgi:hypothetical protein